MPNVAFFITGVGSLRGGGGAERFFADFYQKYHAFDKRKFRLYYFLDDRSIENLNDVGLLRKVPLLVRFRLQSNRLKDTLESLQLCWLIIRHRIRILHIPLYNSTYIAMLKTLMRLPAFLRPKLAINIVSCSLVPNIKDVTARDHLFFKNLYRPLFEEIKADGYFCWNRSFEDYVTGGNVLHHPPKLVYSITSRFSNVENFFPSQSKEKWVVFASRLDAQKHPELFVRAVHLLKKEQADLIKGWQFILCGDGPLREDLINYAKENSLDDLLRFEIEGQMERIFNKSAIYVSCQDYDNFPSLSMAEAMASGNAIVARNVGQTDLFVKHGSNGLLSDPDNEQGLAQAIGNLITDPEKVRRMGEASVKLIQDVHNFKNFVAQIEGFWHALINNQSRIDGKY